MPRAEPARPGAALSAARTGQRLAGFLLTWLALSCSGALAQERWREPLGPEDDGSAAYDLRAAVSQGDWEAAVRLADTYRGQPHSQFSQMASFVYAWSGRHDLVQAMRQEGLIRRTRICDAPPSMARSLIERIDQDDGDARIIIIQERHSQVRHRLALLALLAPLRQRGFTHFAAEDFRGDPGKYRTITGAVDGFHSRREPVFGQVVRSAIALGYQLSPYEAEFPPPDSVPRSDWEGWRAREMSHNIKTRILDAEPESRVLILAGEGHGREAQTPRMAQSGYRPMALVLSEITGLDPVTIDQTGCERAPAAAVQAPDALFDAVVTDTIERFEPSAYDLQVQHRVERFERHGRTSWLWRLGRTPVSVPAQLRRNGEAVVVEARMAGQPPSATPLDRLYLAEGETLPLMLEPGEYMLTVHKRGRPAVQELAITVE